MEFFDFLSRNWQALTAAPLAFLGSLFIGAIGGYWLAKGHFAGVAKGNEALANATRERLTAAQEDLERSRSRERGAQQEVGFLVGRLTTHGEEIEDLKRHLKALPRMIVANRPPGPKDEAPDGSLWITTGPTDPKL